MDGTKTVACPSCHGELLVNPGRFTYDCGQCGFQVSELEANDLSARHTQEAADLKAGLLRANGWTQGA